MKGPFADVVTFMQVGGQPVRERPEIPVSADVDESVATEVLLIEIRNTLDEAVARLKALTGDERAFRMRIILSEVSELCDGLVNLDPVEVADALADIDYVTIGTAVQFGIPHADVWDAVQASNMAKFPACASCGGTGKSKAEVVDDPPFLPAPCTLCRGFGRVAIKDAQGKVHKPPGWTPPDIAAIIHAAKERP